jgi:hypothetical protein
VQLERALADLDVIRVQVLRSEHYRGYRARSCFATAGLAVAAACYGAAEPELRNAHAYVLYWSAVAAGAVFLSALDVVFGAAARRETLRRSGQVAGQLLPALVLGAVLPWLLLKSGGRASIFIPGLWAALFGLAMFATRPFLPRGVGFVALYYFVAGFALLATAEPGPLSSWETGLVFAVGQAASGFVLREGEERIRHDDA